MIRIARIVMCGAALFVFIFQNQFSTTAKLIKVSQPYISSLINACDQDLYSYSLELDGVELIACFPFPVDGFIASDSNEIWQTASAISLDTHKRVSIQAIPYGLKTGSPAFPEPQAGNSQKISDAISNEYLGSGNEAVVGAQAILFGTEISSVYSTFNNSKDLYLQELVSVVIWVTEAGERIWIIRITQDYPRDTPVTLIKDDMDQLSKLSLASPNLQGASTSLAIDLARGASSPTLNLPESPVGDLPFPSWWSGECNVNNHPSSYPLGGIYRGVKACGPINETVPVNFGAGGTQYEWQCPELSKRYLYLAYGIAPYSANGKDVVWNYTGTRLVKITNGTVGSAPQAGDVISYSGPDTSVGHTSIVSSTSVDQNGNGTITVIEQNASANGIRTHTVSNWMVQSSFDATGWLHDPLSSAPGGYEFCVTEGGRCDFSGTASIAYGANGSFYYQNLSSGTDCNSLVFGDPIPGAQKACYIRGGGPPGYTLCANDGGHCTFNGTADVAYGASLRYLYQYGVTGGIDCNSNLFGGDPIPGTPKACYFKASPACPSVAGKVVLYDLPACQGATYEANAPGLWTSMRTDFNDKAEAIAIPGNWSARLYLHNNETSPSACFTSTDSNFHDDQFSDGTWVANQATWMRVYNSANCGISSPPASPALTSPINGSIMNRSDLITLTWNSSSGATEYYAEISGGPSLNINSGWITSTSWSIGAQWGGAYQWRVMARNAYGQSGWSQAWNLAIKVGSPSNLGAVAISSTQINLSWTASVDAPGNLDGYRIYRDGSPVGSVSSSTTSYSDTSLTPGTLYSYVLKAYKGSTESDPSNTTSATTQSSFNYFLYLPTIIMSCPSYYLDTFNDPGSGWPVGQGSEYDTGYLNGEYKISVKNLFTWVGVTPGILASDFVVSADVRNISGLDGSYGLLFGMSADRTQLYTFEISPNGSYNIWRYDPASTSWTSLANGSSRYINNGAASNHLVIERIGSSLKAYANGQLLVALNDSNYTGQRSIGVVAEEYRSTNLDIRFDNFMVSDLFCNPSILFSPSTGQKSGIRSGITIYSSSTKPRP